MRGGGPTCRRQDPLLPGRLDTLTTNGEVGCRAPRLHGSGCGAWCWPPPPTAGRNPGALLRDQRLRDRVPTRQAVEPCIPRCSRSSCCSLSRASWLEAVAWAVRRLRPARTHLVGRPQSVFTRRRSEPGDGDPDNGQQTRASLRRDTVECFVRAVDVPRHGHVLNVGMDRRSPSRACRAGLKLVRGDEPASASSAHDLWPLRRRRRRVPDNRLATEILGYQP